MNMDAFTVEVAKMELTPGDILVIKSRTPLKKEQMDLIEKQCRRILPVGVKIMILDSDLEVSILEDKTDGK